MEKFDFDSWIFQVIFYGLLPLAFISTLLSSSLRRKKEARRLNKTKIILTLFSGFLVYFAATILVMYSNKNHFFSCNLTTVIPYNGPWEKLDQLSSIDTTELKELFSQDYLFGEDLFTLELRSNYKNSHFFTYALHISDHNLFDHLYYQLIVSYYN